YTRVTEYIRHWRNQSSTASTKTAFVPLHFALGEAFQFDLGDCSTKFVGCDSGYLWITRR
ncbi:MAG: hypothetical protein U1C59_10790, partial [Methylotenera sp.]|nr:hypothetical protein [Methylotenera sp.]